MGFTPAVSCTRSHLCSTDGSLGEAGAGGLYAGGALHSLSPMLYGRVPPLSYATAAAATAAAAAAAAAVPIVRTVLKPWVLLEHYSNDGRIRQSRNPRRCHYHLMPDPRHCARRKRDENAHYTSL